MHDEALRIAAAGRKAGKPLREIAIDLYGARRVDAEWTCGGWMRAQVRRLVHRAQRVDAPPRGPGAGSGVPVAGGGLEQNP